MTVSNQSQLELAIEHMKVKFRELQTRGMEGMAGSVWPVIVRHSGDLPGGRSSYVEHTYSEPFFRNLLRNLQLNVPYEQKGERSAVLKVLIDAHMNGEINIFLYHLGLFSLYGEIGRWREEADFTKENLGKRRAAYAEGLPRRQFVSADDFLAMAWSYQIERRDTHIGEDRRHPFLKQIRVLLHADQYDKYVGTQYYNADWVEPLSGKMECRLWTGEEDPMAPLAIPEGWIEGPIVLGHEGTGNGLRHFVQGVPLHAGRGIQVKFGKGWIEGRYEWMFEKESPIQVHAGDDVFYIREGHQVRIKG